MEKDTIVMMMELLRRRIHCRVAAVAAATVGWSVIYKVLERIGDSNNGE